MKFLIVNTDYPEFLHWLYTQHSELERAPYAEQLLARMDSLFGITDFYSSNLRKLGYEAWDIYANNEFMQIAWAKEHGVGVNESTAMYKGKHEALHIAKRMSARAPLVYVRGFLRPLVRFLRDRPRWFYEVLASQIQRYKPDVLLNQAMEGIDSRFLREMKPHMRLLVGQHAAPLPQQEDFGCYDLIISSLPNLVDYFRRIGRSTELHRLAFEPRVLDQLHNGAAEISVSFIGSLSQNHESRIQLLEYLCDRLDVKVWGPGIEGLPKNSSIHRCYMGQAWGIEMYRTLHRSKITLNHHIEMAGSYANNMRLFEATGVGTLLMTDWKENLGEIFEPGREVVVYRTAEECAELIDYYLRHDKGREAIAQAGQKRTLAEHTYHKRMEELVDIVQRYLLR